MREINKKPFSVGLYIEGLRQLRIVGILGAILLFCSSAIITISNALFTQRQMELYQDSSIVLAILSALEVAPLLLLLFSVFAPVMTLWLFHFMTKRNSSDFLFAIQQRKKLSANDLLCFRRIEEMATARNDNRFRILHLPDNIHRSRRDNFIAIRLDHAYPRALALYLFTDVSCAVIVLLGAASGLAISRFEQKKEAEKDGAV